MRGMSFDLAKGVAVLERTPAVLSGLLAGLPEEWVRNNEGAESWSPYDVVGHLIHGERTDWIPRARIILEQGEARPFDPFDRFAQFEESKGKSLADLLGEFAALRAESLAALSELDLGADDLGRRGTHPELGKVTLGELMAAWVVHDLGHVAQVSRVMAKQWRDAVGPWVEYMPVLGDR